MWVQHATGRAVPRVEERPALPSARQAGGRTTGKWALVLDAEGKRITVQRSRLLIPDAATKAAEAQPFPQDW